MCFSAISRGAIFGSEANVLKRILRPGDVVYDIGANYGWTTVCSAQSVGDKGQVIAFEPSSIALRLLLLNTADRANVKVFPSALGREEGTATFYNAESVDMSSFTAPALGIPIRSEEQVCVTPLDRIVADRALPFPNVIKCDVEGGEEPVFAGAEAVLSCSPMILFEYAEELARPYGYNLEGLINLLLSNLEDEAKVYRVAEDGTTYISLDPRKGISNNYLVVPEKYSDRLSG
jgi:FkbM family methyltransferase